MKKIISSCFLCFCYGFWHNCTAQVLWQIHNNKVTTWHYNTGDEFDNSKVDTSKWLDSYPWGRSLYCSFDNHYYTDFKNCKLENGILSLVAKREKITARSVPYEDDNHRLICDGKDIGKNLRTFDYTCGMIFSKKKFHYGFYEMKFRSDMGKGLWPAFWLYAGHENEEIDVFEINGSKDSEFHVDVHCITGCNNYKTTLGIARKNWGDYLTSSGNWNQSFNVLSIEWQQDFIKWFLNGKPVAYWKGNFTNPMWVIADIALSRDNGPFSPGPDASTVFPASFDIDYIRMWSARKATSNQNMENLNIPSIKNTKPPSEITKGSRPESKNKLRKENHTFILFASSAMNHYYVEISGTPIKNFVMEVSDGSGNKEYKSTDGGKKIHEFKFSGKGKIKIVADGKVLEQTF